MAIAGNSKGQTGIVQAVNGEKITVQGLNLRKKHIKRTQDTPGRIIDMEASIHISNLRVCVNEDTTAKLKVRTDETGNRQFVYSKDGQEFVYRTVKKPK